MCNAEIYYPTIGLPPLEWLESVIETKRSYLKETLKIKRY